MTLQCPDEPVRLAQPGRLHQRLRSELLTAIAAVVDSGRFILGPEVRAFEQEAARALGVQHAVGVSSGTDALVCALSAAGVGAGDVVLTTSLSFVATATAIARLGATPRFCDVDPETFNLDVDNLAEELLLGVKAVLPVHLFGLPASVGRLRERCGSTMIVEDAAQAFGASSDDGLVGALGDLAAFSFFPAKPLGAMGDGGLVTTHRAGLAEECRALRMHGREQDGRCHRVGGNCRLDEVQAAVLRVLLPWDAERRALRRARAETYHRELSDVTEVIAPAHHGHVEHAWSVYAIRACTGRDALRAYMEERGVQTAVYYERPLPFEPFLAGLGYSAGDFPVAEQLCNELLALPISSEMTEGEQSRVIDAVRAFYRG